MEETIELNDLTLRIMADDIREMRDYTLISGSRVTLSLPRSPKRYLRHGWQSWSLAAWTELTPLPVQKPTLLHPLQTDPVYTHEKLPHGSWFGAVEFEDGSVLLLGALGLETHVRLNGDQLEGWNEAGTSVEWLVAYGEEKSIFADYVELLGNHFGQVEKKSAPRIWCSWYSLYTIIDEALLYRVFDELGDLPFDVLQVDDGWQVAIGDWEANAKFPSGMSALAEKIKSTGRQAGLWLAPLIAVRSSKLFRKHPDWFLKDARGGFVSAGFNWSEPLVALDTTHPAALDWLAALMKQVRAWGFDYLKLDFLYAGALPGVRHENMPREAAYRHGVQAMREAMGADAFFLTCGAPIFPSLGLCDALRVGPDVAGEWESQRDTVLLYNPTTPSVKNAIRTTLHRMWLSPLVQTDPDVAYFAARGNSLTPEQKQMLQDLALVCNFRATSDLPQWLSTEERESLRGFLKDKHKPIQMEQYSFKLGKRVVDFSSAMSLPHPARGFDSVQSAVIGWLGSQGWALRILDRMGKSALEKMKKEL
jgi:alpha-galactosidase